MKPPDIADPIQRLRLRSYVWPDQTARLARFDGAADLAESRGVSVDKADAAKWLERELVDTPDGVLTVVAHSVFFQYPPKETRAAITAAIEAAGSRATQTAPLAWLRLEPEALFGEDAEAIGMTLDLRCWPGDGAREVLAHTDGHVTAVQRGRLLGGLGPSGKTLRDSFINRALERNGEPRRLGKFGPTPGIEFRRRQIKLYIGIRAVEAQRIPFLALSDIWAGQPRLQIARKLVIEPVFGRLENGDELGRHPDFLFHLPQGCSVRVFPGINTTLWHLPLEGTCGVHTAAEEDVTAARKQRDPDIGPEECGIRLSGGRYRHEASTNTRCSARKRGGRGQDIPLFLERCRPVANLLDRDGKAKARTERMAAL